MNKIVRSVCIISLLPLYAASGEGSPKQLGDYSLSVPLVQIAALKTNWCFSCFKYENAIRGAVLVSEKEKKLKKKEKEEK